MYDIRYNLVFRWMLFANDPSLLLVANACVIYKKKKILAEFRFTNHCEK